MPMRRRPAGATENPVRSVRVADELWAQAKARAKQDGVTISYVVQMLVNGYALGEFDLPEIKVVTVYGKPDAPD